MRWLLVDANNLCHRNFHAMHRVGLSHDGMPTEVVFGFMRDIASIGELFDVQAAAFAFDRGAGKRRDIYPAYKANRQRRREDEQELYERLSMLIGLLRDRYLPNMGFVNVLSAPGFEADDLIAGAVDTILDKPNQEIVIVSGDADLWQCLRPGVSCYSPASKKLMTRERLMEVEGLEPWEWLVSMSLTGCSSDNVRGIPGIGPVKARKHIRGELPEESVDYRKIVSSKGLRVATRNLRLIRLPFEGMPPVRIRRERATRGKVRDVFRSLGIRSLEPPGWLPR